MDGLNFLFEDSKTLYNTKIRTMSLEVEEYLRKYGIDIHIDKPEYDVKDTKAIFIKGDKNSSVLKANIYFGGLPMDLTGYTILANVKEELNEIVTIPVNIQDAQQGIIEINLPSNVVDEQGINTFELSFQKSGVVLVTHKFSYTVLDSLGEGFFGDDTQLTTLQTLIQQVQETKVTVENIVKELEVAQSDINDILEMVGGL